MSAIWLRYPECDPKTVEEVIVQNPLSETRGILDIFPQNNEYFGHTRYFNGQIYKFTQCQWVLLVYITLVNECDMGISFLT